MYGSSRHGGGGRHVGHGGQPSARHPTSHGDHFDPQPNHCNAPPGTHDHAEYYRAGLRHMRQARISGPRELQQTLLGRNRLSRENPEQLEYLLTRLSDWAHNGWISEGLAARLQDLLDSQIEARRMGTMHGSGGRRGGRSMGGSAGMAGASRLHGGEGYGHHGGRSRMDDIDDLDDEFGDYDEFDDDDDFDDFDDDDDDIDEEDFGGYGGYGGHVCHGRRRWV